MPQHVCTVGIDLAKTIFHLVGTDITGKMVWRKRLTRHALVPFLAQLPPVTISGAAARLPFTGAVGHVHHVRDLPLRVGDHRPRQ